MSEFIWFLIGCGVGSFVAFIVLAVFTAGKSDDDEINFKNK